MFKRVARLAYLTGVAVVSLAICALAIGVFVAAVANMVSWAVWVPLVFGVALVGAGAWWLASRGVWLLRGLPRQLK